MKTLVEVLANIFIDSVTMMAIQPTLSTSAYPEFPICNLDFIDCSIALSQGEGH